MKKFKVEKLIRDNIFDNIRKNKFTKIEYKKLDNKEFLEKLKKKFYEELEEFDLSDEKNIKNELADLQLIMDYFLKTLNISKKELTVISKDKNKKVGVFDKRIYLKNIELDENDDWFSYYQKRYEEIK